MKGLKLNDFISFEFAKNQKFETIETKKGYFLPLSAEPFLISKNIEYIKENFENSDFEINEPSPSTLQKIKNFFGL